MPDPTPDRRAELVAAAVSGSLTDAERVEFDALRRRDPAVDAEVLSLREVAERMPRSLSTWDDARPSARLRDRIAALSEGRPAENQASRGPSPAAMSATPPPTRRRGWVTALAAAACLVVGAGVGVAATNAIGSIDPTGAPGTLGAVEEVDFTGEPGGVAVDGALVAHTWGTETVLEIDGLPVGDTYSVIVTTDSGARLTAGSFLGSENTVDCRMNAAVMRSDAIAIEIEDATGAIVTTATLPTVE